MRRSSVGPRLASLIVLVLALVATPAAGRGQAADGRASESRSNRFPFGVGERHDFEARFGGVRVGTAFMEVYGFEQLRGRDAYHTMFRIRGGTLFFKVDSRFDSWIDAASFSSLRFRQDQNEGGRDRERQYEIFPERAAYRDEQGQEFESVRDPLDDGSFLYFVRTTPLEVGREYEYNRYFKPDRNPVRIRVLRRERVKVPAGSFDAVVVQPIIKAKGLFSEGGHAEVWISDDPRRQILQIRTRFAGLGLSMHLTGYRAPVSGGPNVSGASSGKGR